jgi:dTMP kinase
VKTPFEIIKNMFRTPETPGSFFISLEGIEGSGKSTQIQEIEAYVQQSGLRVLTLREPGGTIFGEQLRQAILKSQTPLHPLAECHLFLASRAQLLEEKILPFLLTPGSVVIMDRYIDSTLAYQGKAGRLGYETILTLHQYDPLNLLPHRTYFLDIDLEVSMTRQQARGNVKDYFESQQVEFYQQLIDGYRELADIFPERIKKIEASAPASSISLQIINDMRKFIS